MKKLVSVALALCMVTALLPVTALAADVACDLSYGSVTIDASSNTVTYTDASGAQSATIDADSQVVITQKEYATATTANNISITGSGSVNITLSGVNILPPNGCIMIGNDTVTVNLTLEGTNILAGYEDSGIVVPVKATLNIGGSGSVTVTATKNEAPGIGSYAYGTGTISINGGNVTSRGGTYGAGIGGGQNDAGGTVNISGGKVTAPGRSYGHGAGIGGGDGGSGGTVNISGGTVNVSSGFSGSGAGIGGGGGGAGGTVTISGGTVTVTGSYFGSCIGGGNNGSGGIVYISGGSVLATGTGTGAAPIGKGYGGSDNGTLQNNSTDKTKVYLTTATLADASGTNVGAAEIASLTTSLGGSSYSYGTTDMQTDSNGKLYIYLPESTEATAAVSLGERFTGSITANTAGTAAGLFIKTAVISASAVSVTYDGSSHVGYTVTDVKNADGDTISTGTYTITPTYYSGSTATGAALGGAPTDAGTYTVLLSLVSTNYTASVPVTYTVSKQTATISASSANYAYDGNSHAGYTITSVKDASNNTIPADQYTATPAYYSGSNATGTALGGAPTDAGTYTVLLSLANTNYSASVPVTFTVEKHPPSLTLIASNSADTGGVKVTLTATLSKPGGGAYPTGTVVFKQGTTVLGSAALSSGLATYDWITASTGTFDLSAEYQGDGNYSTAAVTLASYDVSKYNQSDLIISGVPATVTYGDSDFTLTASGGSGGGAVSWSSTDVTTASVDSTGKVTVHGTGSCTITATKAADYTYNERSAVTIFTVQKAVPTISTLPTASSIGSGSALSASTLTGGMVTGVNSEAVTGSFAWTDSSITITADGSYSVTFTPDSTNYTTASAAVAVSLKSSGGYSSGSSASYNIKTSTSSGVTTTATTATAAMGSDGTANASVTNGQLAAAIDAAVKQAAESGTKSRIEITVIAPDAATGVSLTVPQSAFKALADSSIGSLRVTTSLGSATFDSKAIDAMNSNASGNVTITIKEADTSSLSAEDKTKIGDRPVYDLSVTSGNSVISSFDEGTATVSIPYTLADGEDANNVVIYYISGSGQLVTIPNCVYDAKSGTVTFTTTHFSIYAVGYNDVSFTDVSGWYKDYVSYLAARGIINGTGDGIFSPDANITRAQFVAIFARMSGDDLDGYTSSSFSDVAATDWYFAAVQWAYKNGVASGSDGKFSPDANITREQMAVMLYNYAKYAGADVANVEGMSVREFSDYGCISSWAQAPIQWAINNGIVSGNSDGTFAPAANATRAQAAKMVALLLQELSEI